MIQIVSRPDSEAPLDAEAAAHALFEVQGFCSEHGFPEGLLKKIYYALYDADVINESAFAIWKARESALLLAVAHGGHPLTPCSP